MMDSCQNLADSNHMDAPKDQFDRIPAIAAKDRISWSRPIVELQCLRRSQGIHLYVYIGMSLLSKPFTPSEPSENQKLVFLYLLVAQKI